MSAAAPASGLARRLFENTLHSASGRLASLALWVLFTPPILRALGSERFAIWSLFYALTGYLAAFDFGLAQGTLRFVAAARARGDHDDAGTFATLALLGYGTLALIWAALATLLAGTIVGWLRVPPALADSACFAIQLGALVFLLSGVANVTMAATQGYGRFDLANLTLVTTTVAQAAGLLLVLRRGLGLEGFVLSVAVAATLGAAMGLLLLRWRVPGFRWASPGRAWGRVGPALRFGVPMQATNLLAVMNAQMDKLLLARFAGLSMVTVYELGSRVAVSVTSLPQLVLLPVMAEAASMSAAGERERLRSLYDRGSRYFLTLAAVCVAPLLAAGPRLYAAWLGGPHPEATLALRGLTLAAALTLATGMATTIARGVGRTEFEAWFATTTVALHLALSLLLMPTLGLRGALIASMVSHAVGSLLFMGLFSRLMQWPLFGEVLRPWARPALAVLGGWAAGAALDRALPGSAGAAGWMVLLVVALTSGLVTLGLTIATRFFHWDEARRMLLGRFGAAVADGG